MHASAPPARGQRRAAGPAARPFGATGRPRVAVVNHAPYHLEIVAGWLALLRRADAEVIWYQAGQPAPAGGGGGGGGAGFTPEELLESQRFHDLFASSDDGDGGDNGGSSGSGGGGAAALEPFYRLVPADAPPVEVDFALFISPEYYERETAVGIFRLFGGGGFWHVLVRFALTRLDCCV